MQINLLQHIRKFVDLNESEAHVLSRYIQRQKIKRKEFVLQEGKVCRDLIFVESGCLRMYFINKKLNEQIVQFAIDGWWLADFFSYLDNTPSEYYIQAVEASEIVTLDKISFNNLVAELPLFENYFRIIQQKALATFQLRSKLMYEMSKEEFYQHFSSSFPEFMQRVPQYMLASYLGLTPEYMSELRKKII